MSRARLAVLLLLAFPGPSGAGDFELAGFAGLALPSYDETISYDPGLGLSGIPGVTVSQQGRFTLSAEAGLALGGAATYYFAGILGVEARLDTADVTVKVSNPAVQVKVDLPSPLPDISEQVTLTPGRVDLERLLPLSLNLKLRTRGSARFAMSGGLSYLPAFKMTVTQPLGLGVTGVIPDIELGSLAYRARASPSGEGQGRWGANLGAGLQIGLGDTLALVAEGRAFVFQQQTLTWSRADNRPLSAAEAALAEELELRLRPVEFNPTFLQATAGIAIRF